MRYHQMGKKSAEVLRILGCRNSLLKSRNPKNDVSPAFLEHSSAEKIAV
jgi:hypothetical protein